MYSSFRELKIRKEESYITEKSTKHYTFPLNCCFRLPVCLPACLCVCLSVDLSLAIEPDMHTAALLSVAKEQEVLHDWQFCRLRTTTQLEMRPRVYLKPTNQSSLLFLLHSHMRTQAQTPQKKKEKKKSNFQSSVPIYRCVSVYIFPPCILIMTHYSASTKVTFTSGHICNTSGQLLQACKTNSYLLELGNTKIS